MTKRLKLPQKMCTHFENREISQNREKCAESRQNAVKSDQNAKKMILRPSGVKNMISASAALIDA